MGFNYFVVFMLELIEKGDNSPIISIIIIIIIIVIIQVSSIFPYSPLPSGTWQLQACPFPDVVFPLLPQSALSSFPFHCALQDGFRQT